MCALVCLYSLQLLSASQLITIIHIYHCSLPSLVSSTQHLQLSTLYYISNITTHHVSIFHLLCQCWHQHHCCAQVCTCLLSLCHSTPVSDCSLSLTELCFCCHSSSIHSFSDSQVPLAALKNHLANSTDAASNSTNSTSTLPAAKADDAINHDDDMYVFLLTILACLPCQHQLTWHALSPCSSSSSVLCNSLPPTRLPLLLLSTSSLLPSSTASTSASSSTQLYFFAPTPTAPTISL